MSTLSPFELARRNVVLSCSNDNPWAIRNPQDEARDLYRMVAKGSCSVDSIRELIDVPTNIEAALLAYAKAYPKDGERIHCVLQFRRKVGAYFEELVQQQEPLSASESQNFETEPNAELEPALTAGVGGPAVGPCTH